MHFSGADKLALDAHGDVLMQLGSDQLMLRKPLVYQQIDGKRRLIGGGYRLLGGDTVSIDVASYDRSQPLVIDPVMGPSWATPPSSEAAWPMARPRSRSTRASMLI